jgi:hypothetical protein
MHVHVEPAKLDELVVRYLDRMQAAGEALLDELCRAHPDCAEHLRARIELLRRLGLDGEPFDAGLGLRDDLGIGARRETEGARRALFARWLRRVSEGESRRPL